MYLLASAIVVPVSIDKRQEGFQSPRAQVSRRMRQRHGQRCQFPVTSSGHNSPLCMLKLELECLRCRAYRIRENSNRNWHWAFIEEEHHFTDLRGQTRNIHFWHGGQANATIY